MGIEHRLCETVKDTKNSFCWFIYASNWAMADGSVVPSDAAQLAGFPASPQVRTAIDWRDDPQHARTRTGTDQVAHPAAVSVADRAMTSLGSVTPY